MHSSETFVAKGAREDESNAVLELSKAEEVDAADEVTHKAYLGQTSAAYLVQLHQKFIKDGSDHKEFFVANVKDVFSAIPSRKPYQDVQLMADMIQYANKIEMEFGDEERQMYIPLLLERIEFSNLVWRIISFEWCVGCVARACG